MSSFGSEINYQQKFTSKQATTSDFFSNLQGRAKKIAHLLAEKHANTLADTLTHRKNLGKGWGNYPRWNTAKFKPTPPSKKPSNKSFNGWYVEPKGNGVFNLRNDVVSDDIWSYSYVRNLTNGTGWSAKAKAGIGKEGGLLVRGGYGKIFSKQMPFGLMPWLRFKKETFRNDLKKQFGDLT